MLDDLHTALEAAAWPRALEAALATWRETRAPSMVPLIDAIAARCRIPGPEDAALHDWWIAQAHAYDPVTATALLARLDAALGDGIAWSAIRARYKTGSNPVLYAVILGSDCSVSELSSLALLDRLARMVAWPADPRVARRLVDVLALPLPWNDGALHGLYVAIADWLIRIGDPAVRPVLEALADEPRGPSPQIRAVAEREARRALAALPEARAQPIDAEVATWTARLDGERAAADHRRAALEAALWAAVAASPDDDAPRLVLADLLIERGEPRGELIVQQCRGGQPGRTCGSPEPWIEAHWHAWLGDLALVASPEGSVFERGMLSAIRVGRLTTPPWAYAKLRGHRELGAVRTVHRGHASATQYAALLAGLPRLPDELQLDAPDLIAPLRAIRERWPTRTIDCAERAEPRPFDRHWLVQARPALAAMFPALETLRLAPWRRDAAATHARLIGELPAGFPTLRRIVVDLHGLRAYEPGGRAELDEIAKLPLVEWLDPAQLPRWPPWPLARATAG